MVVPVQSGLGPTVDRQIDRQSCSPSTNRDQRRNRDWAQAPASGPLSGPSAHSGTLEPQRRTGLAPLPNWRDRRPAS